MSLEERFWAKVNKTNDCWLWTGCQSEGYGYIRHNKKSYRTNRVSWELHFGSIPLGLLVCHKCDNPSCVRPDHLFLGTNLENTQDRDRKKRNKSPKGEQHGSAKLTISDILAIRELHTQKIQTVEIARRFGVCRSHISEIIHRKFWKHI